MSASPFHQLSPPVNSATTHPANTHALVILSGPWSLPLRPGLCQVDTPDTQDEQTAYGSGPGLDASGASFW